MGEKERLKPPKKEYKAAYEASLDDKTGQLYNHFISFISEANLPLYHVLVVLDILKAEVVEQIRRKQGLK